MATEVNDNVNILAPKPADERLSGGFSGGHSISYPYLAAVLAKIPEGNRYQGMTVPVLDKEYWFRDGITNADLVLKITSGDDFPPSSSEEFTTL